MPLTEKLVLGTAQLGMKYGINNQLGKPSSEKAMEILSAAAAHGIDTLDTASGYGDAEKTIAEFHRGNPHFKIITKFAINENFSVEEECKRVCDLLAIPALESFMYHRWNDITNKEVRSVLLNLKDERRIKKIGVSVYGNDQLAEAIDLEWIDVIQAPFNLLDNFSQRGELLTKANEKAKEIHVRSVFLQGLFFMNTESLPGNLQPLRGYLNQLNDIAKNAHCSIAALALQYAVSRPMVSKVLIGVEQKSQLEENIKMLEGRITDDIFNEVDSIYVKERELLSPVNW